jgi:dihydroorotate dehydrogenase
LKLTADLSFKEADEIIALCAPRKWITGFILTNLVKDRSNLKLKSPPEQWQPYKGGFSGKVTFEKALALTRHFHKRAAKRFVLIGCGGIFTAEDAYAYIRSGASLVQLITGMIYGGPAAISDINKGLVKLLKKDGYSNISEAVGAAR